MRKIKNASIEFVFKTGDDKNVSAFLPIEKIVELCEEEAYEIITKPECNCSSCDVNGFCECEPINEDAEFQHIVFHVENISNN